jgi:ubiquinone/menaquinone biosynthesis C-methylase UbiE
MDAYNYLAITHANTRFCSPLSGKMVEQVSDLLNLKPGSRVLDLGCGKAEMMLRLASRWQIHGVGVDPSPHYIQAAHEAMSEFCPGADLHLHEAEPLAFTGDGKPWDVILCVNAARQMNGYENALQHCKQLVVSGGLIVMGAYFWDGSPQPELAAVLDLEIEEATYDTRIQTGIDHGLTPVYAVPATQGDLDHYHWVQVYAAEQYCADNPESPEAQMLHEQTRIMRDSYRNVRKSLSFGMFLFRKP